MICEAFLTLVHSPGQRLLAGGLLLLAALAGVASGGGFARAETTPPPGVMLGVPRLGFDGLARVGLWTRLVVPLAAGGTATEGRLTVTLADGDGVPVRYAPAPPHGDVVRLAPGQRLEVEVYVRPGSLRPEIELEFVAADGARATRRLVGDERPSAILASQQLVVAVGDAVGFDEAARARRNGERDPEQALVAVVSGAAELPGHWLGYEGVSALVLPTAGNAPLLAEMTPAQWQALDDWVRRGGRLIVSAGRDAAALLAPSATQPAADQPPNQQPPNQQPAAGVLHRFSPGRFTALVRQRNTAGLETFVSATEPLAEAVRRAAQQNAAPGTRGLDLEAHQLELALLADVVGKVDPFERATEGFRPVVVRRPLGLGLVLFVACDLDRAPLSLWADRPRLAGRLLDAALGERPWLAAQEQRSGQLSHMGYDDLMGQLRGVLDQFPGVAGVGFLWIVALVALYALLVGPGDYLLLRHWLGPMEWTWLTFPAVTLAVCAGAWWLSGWLKGTELRMNQLEVVDIDLATDPGQAHLNGTLWAHVFSPETRAYDVALAAPLPWDAARPAQGALAWHGLPGDGFGGLHQAAPPAPPAGAYALQWGDDEHPSRLLGLPIDVHSSKSLTARWWHTQPRFPYDLRLVESAGGPPQGEVANPLPMPLRDARLLYDRWMYNLGTLQPGERRAVNWQLAHSDFEYRLTGRRVQESKDQSTPWDQASLDPERVAEMVLFHESAGGRGYTRLLHRHQPFADLTGLLRNGRAILVGRLDVPAAELTQNGQPLAPAATRRWTWCRLVLPVVPQRFIAPPSDLGG